MLPDEKGLDIAAEAKALAEAIVRGDPRASVHLARLIEADHKGIFRPFAEAMGARIKDHVVRCCQLCAEGTPVEDLDIQDETYHLMKMSAIDWDGLPAKGRPGEEG
ncbi:MAG: hypothetical protein JSV80_08430 [Acidobacteriota bacterium]|nr:MAG: hypothetical protein JSV80_08430 [Acidobacteriota bacterium]